MVVAIAPAGGSRISSRRSSALNSEQGLASIPMAQGGRMFGGGPCPACRRGRLRSPPRIPIWGRGGRNTMTTTYDFDLARARSRGARVARIDALATLLDTALVIPGTGVRFGLDALIGLFPVVGDIITTGLSLFIVHEAYQLGAPGHVIARMLGNVAV